MESIFDHSPTDEELESLFGKKPSQAPEFFDRLKKYAQKDGSSPTTLVRLFSLRGEKDEVQRCLAMIEDPSERFEAEYLLLETA